MRGLVVVAAAAGLAGVAGAQPATAIRFVNGTNQITVAPGAVVPVSIYATGMPASGTNIPWTTPPGTGQIGHYAGFLSAFMNLLGSGGTPSAPAIPGGMGYQNPPFGSAGTVSGSNVTGISIGVGFNPPVTGSEFLLWTGIYTVGSSNVTLSTLLRPVGNPPQTGFEVGLSGIGELSVSHFFTTANGTALITVPAPGGVILLGLGGRLGARRRVERKGP